MIRNALWILFSYLIYPFQCIQLAFLNREAIKNKNTIITLERRLTGYHSTIYELADRLVLSEMALKNQQSMCHSLRQSNALLEKDMKGLAQDNSCFSKELKEKESMLLLAEKSNAELKQQLAKKEEIHCDELALLRHRIDQKSKDYDTIRMNSFSDVRSELGKANAHLQELNSLINTMDSENVQISRTALENVGSIIAVHSTELKTLQKDWAQGMAELKKHYEEIISAQLQSEEAQSHNHILAIQSQDAKLKALEQEKFELNERILQMNESFQQQQATYDELLTNYNYIMDTKKQQENILEHKIKELIGDIAKKDTVLKETKDACETAIHTLNEKLLELEEKHKDIVQDLNQKFTAKELTMQQALEAKEKDLAQLEKHISELEQALSQAETQTNKNVEILYETQAQLKQSLQVKENEIQAAAIVLAEKEKFISELKEKLVLVNFESEKSCKGLKEELETVKEELAKSVKKEYDKDCCINELQKQATLIAWEKDELQKKVTAFIQENEAMQEKWTALQQEKGLLKEQKEAIESEFFAQSQANANLETQMHGIKEQIFKLKQELELRSQEASTNANVIKSLEKEKELLLNEFETEKQKNANLCNEITELELRLKENWDSTTFELKANEKEIHELTETLRHYSSSLKESQMRDVDAIHQGLLTKYKKTVANYERFLNQQSHPMNNERQLFSGLGRLQHGNFTSGMVDLLAPNKSDGSPFLMHRMGMKNNMMRTSSMDLA